MTCQITINSVKYERIVVRAYRTYLSNTNNDKGQETIHDTNTGILVLRKRLSVA